jgi:S-adenosylmethionine:tRNA-ribosyltransferase-isomerase (queuine synthetase)
LIWELLTGQTSGASAICAERLSDSQDILHFKNNTNFKEGEIVFFEESKIQAVVTTLNTSSLNVSFNYTYSNGQNASFYDYGELIKSQDTKETREN